MSLRLIFMGTPHFSTPVLEKLISAGHQICAVYSQPPRKSGRGMKPTPSPVHIAANNHNIEVFTPLSLKSQQQREQFERFNADACVVVAYGMILPQDILDAPKFGCLNIHASLLPRWRGAAPIQRAIMAGDKETGVSIMQMEAGLDTGPTCLHEKIAINELTTASKLHDDLSQMGAKLIIDALAQIEAGKARFTPQPQDGVTYAKKIEKAEAKINFNKPAKKVLAHIHGLSPFPGAWFELPTKNGHQRIKLITAEPVEKIGNPGEVLDDQLTIACAHGAIRPVRLQRQGKGAMALADFLRGGQVTPGTMV